MSHWWLAVGTIISGAYINIITDMNYYTADTGSNMMMKIKK